METNQNEEIKSELSVIEREEIKNLFDLFYSNDSGKINPNEFLM